MKHRKSFNKLNRDAAHRKALLKNMVTVLIKHERIVTTKAKAKELQRVVEKMITRAKEDTVHNRRIIAESIHDKVVHEKLFKDVAVRMKERNGGYTRVLKIGERNNDAAKLVLIEFVDRKVEDDKDKKKKDKKARKAKEQTK